MEQAPRRQLRELLAGDRIVLAPGAYDALLARLIEQAGFSAIYMTGSGVSNTLIGQPDLGLVTMKEMADKVASLAEVVSIPIIADADTGYGNALNVQRTVRAYERAGVSAIQLEDQTFPKRCGHLDGKDVISASEMLDKLHAAVDARTDPDLVIVARTDSRAIHGIEDAIERGQRYAEAGADLIFVEAPRTVEEMRQITAAIDQPCLANLVEGGKTPILPAAELEQIGYRVAIYANALTRVIARAASDALQVLKRDGTTAALAERMEDLMSLNAIVGLPAMLATAERYSSHES
ncbi:MAG: oxaloacetate decarboxylase [Chloroflexota bacterium]